MTFTNILFALTGGILPALLWLWFWLKEDRLHPEPRRLIIWTFVLGMAAVIVALPVEQGVHYVLKEYGLLPAMNGLLLLLFWALAEEILKYFAAKKAALNSKEYDEPVDALIYMITAALGFAAMENVIFLIAVCMDYGLFSGFITGNLRFVGATLLHILSSAVVGSAIAFSFFHKENYRRNVFWGLLFATLLHTLFNYFIMKSGEQNLFQVFLPFWLLIIPLLLIFERVKRNREKSEYSKPEITNKN